MHFRVFALNAAAPSTPLRGGLGPRNVGAFTLAAAATTLVATSPALRLPSLPSPPFGLRRPTQRSTAKKCVFKVALGLGALGVDPL